MNWQTIQTILIIIQHSISFIGVLIILSGVVLALAQYIYYYFSPSEFKASFKINAIRLYLGRIIILGLEFIIAADLIGTTTAPDYYTVGLLAIIIVIRTLLSYSLNRELIALSDEQAKLQ